MALSDFLTESRQPDFIKRACRGLDELTGFHRLKELSHRHSGKDAVSIMVCHGRSDSGSHVLPGRQAAGDILGLDPGSRTGIHIVF